MSPSVIGRLASVNVGEPREVQWFDRTVLTGIWKEPVDGPIQVETENLAGDRQADLRVHGGPDKAVYAYGSEDLAWWSAGLGEDLTPGTFGENLTTTGVDVSGAVLGDLWEIGTTVLEVCQPREPCFKLGIRMGDAAFVDEFARAHRPGTYLRVVQTGSVTAGDDIVLAHRPDDALTVVDLLDAVETGDEITLRRIVANAAATAGWRHTAERALLHTASD